MHACLEGRKPDRRQVVGANMRGGMADTCRGIQTCVGSKVAIAVLLGDFLQDGSTRQRCNRDVKNNAGLSHPQILPACHVRERDNLATIITAPVRDTRAVHTQRRVRLSLGTPVRPAQRVVLSVCASRKQLPVQHSFQLPILHHDEQPDAEFAGISNALLTGLQVADHSAAYPGTSESRRVSKPGLPDLYARFQPQGTRKGMRPAGLPSN